MLSILLSAFLLAACTICMHAAGISLLLRYSTRARAHPPTTPFAISRTLLRVVWWLLLLHLAEIALWALFYLWRGYLPDAEAAFYFSGVTYTTIGYGDIVLAKSYRLLAPVEGLVTPIPLQNAQVVPFDFLIRREPVLAGETLPPAPDYGLIFNGA